MLRRAILNDIVECVSYEGYLDGSEKTASLADVMFGAADGASSKITSFIVMSLVHKAHIANTANGMVISTVISIVSPESKLENTVPIAIRASRIPVIR